jgi:diguanylate cyclase (GGDEF)-like protein/PAS domain S-box-containing protein
MAAARKDRSGRKRNAALKDNQLIYRACTEDFARSLQLQSAADLAGKSDFNLLPEPIARVYQAIEQQVLETGIPDVSSGRLSQSQSEEVVVVRSPVIADSGDVTGIEVNVLNLRELKSDYAEMLTRDLNHRKFFNRFPFGVRIQRNDEIVFQNRRWSQLTESYQSQVEQWMQSQQDEGVSDDNLIYLQRSELFWQGEQLQGVFCFPRRPGSDPFVEKRKGARRDKQPLDNAALSNAAVAAEAVESTIFKALKFAVLICDDWVPVYRNNAAKHLFETLTTPDAATEAESDSVENWFSDLEKADIEIMMRQRELVEVPLLTSVNLAGREYAVSVSPASWSGRSALLITLQNNTQLQSRFERVTTELEKYSDFVAAAGDFQWEMDSDQKMTHLSVNVEPVLGVSNADVLGVPLSAIIERYVDSEDMAQWSVLSVDMRSRQPFRDREFKWLHRSGSKRVVRLSGVPVFDRDKQFTGYRGIGSDFTEEYNLASAMAFHASHDSLTGLVNRREFEQRCDSAIGSARDNKITHALCFLDLDNFKVVNDTCGHIAGDELLRQLSALFSGLVRKSDVLARLGGDEFAVLVYDVGVNEVLRLANQLRSEVEAFQFLWEGNRFSVGASIGVVIIDDRWEDRPALFGAADAACYEAKNLGRNRVSVYNETRLDVEAGSAGPGWIDRITSAVKEKRVRLAMQKILALNEFNQPVTRVELLARLLEQSQLIEPGVFMPAADRYGLTVDIDKAVVERAIDWLEGQPHVTDTMQMCSINLHGRSFADEDFTVFLIKALRAAKFDVSILCFEVTETAAIANLSGVTQFMKRVGETGCKFALDDFGGGLSSFSYLKNLPVSYLKIDGKYIRNILQESVDYAMVKAINEIGHTLGKQTIAEFVESDDVLQKLRELGVDLAQGYQIGKPELIDF